MTRTYEELLAEVLRLQDEGHLPSRPTREQVIDWVYGNTKLANPKITYDVVTKAVDERRTDAGQGLGFPATERR